MENVRLIFTELLDFLSINVGGISIFWVLVVLTALYVVWRLF